MRRIHTRFADMTATRDPSSEIARKRAPNSDPARPSKKVIESLATLFGPLACDRVATIHPARPATTASDTTPARRHHLPRDSTGGVASDGGADASAARASSMSSRASPMSRVRRVRSFSRHRRNRRRIAGGTWAGRRPKSGGAPMTLASVSVVVGRRKGDAPVSSS